MQMRRFTFHPSSFSRDSKPPEFALFDSFHNLIGYGFIIVEMGVIL